MKIDRLLDDTRMTLSFSGTSFNENYDVFSYPEELWVEFDVNDLIDLVQSRGPRYFDHPFFLQKYNHPIPNIEEDLKSSDNVYLFCKQLSVTPCKINGDEPGISFGGVVSGSYYSFKIKVEHLETLINKWRVI